MSPFAARLVKTLDDQIKEDQSALERGLPRKTYWRTCGEIAARRAAIDLIRVEDRAYQTDDEDDEQPADTEAA